MSWRDQNERGNLSTVRLMRRLTQLLPRSLARQLLHPIALYFLLTSTPARRASRDFLARATGRPSSLWQVYRHYLSFATVVMDRVYLLTSRFDCFAFSVEGEDIALGVLGRKRGLFLLGAHIGSFEVLRAVGRHVAVPPIAMVMYEENARAINAALAEIDPALAREHEIIGLGRPDSMLRVRDALDRGAIIGILADRLLDAQAGASDLRRLPFMGRLAPFPVGPFRMAALLRRPVMLMLGIHLGGNRYHLVFEPIHDFSDDLPAQRPAAIDAAMQAYVARLEHYATRYPLNWFNFFDVWQGDDATTDPPLDERARLQ
ncbi:MAG: acyl-CoA synthetase [Lautropia sp.]